jgi:hypothetical protein
MKFENNNTKPKGKIKKYILITLTSCNNCLKKNDDNVLKCKSAKLNI